MQDLHQFNDSQDDTISPDDNSLDMVVDQALKGVDIRQKFPTFYRKLLQSRSLRTQFIDAITLNVNYKQMTQSLPQNKATLDFSFLHNNLRQLSGWPVFLKQEKSQLMDIFFPAQVVYRDGGNVGSKLIYTLLRKDFVLKQTSYTVLLESSLAEDEAEVLHPCLNLTVNQAGTTKAFPLQASLRWGDYSSELLLNEEGKHPLPDIPLSAVFTADLDQVKSDLFLSLNSIAS